MFACTFAIFTFLSSSIPTKNFATSSKGSTVALNPILIGIFFVNAFNLSKFKLKKTPRLFPIECISSIIQYLTCSNASMNFFVVNTIANDSGVVIKI